MLFTNLVANAVLALSLVTPSFAPPRAALAPGAPTRSFYGIFRGGSVDVPYTPCSVGLWWDGLCTDSCDARVCVWVAHWKLVCAGAVVFDFGWLEVTVEEDGRPPRACGFAIGDLPKGGPYPAKTYTPRCGDAWLIVVDVEWSGDEPEIRALSCVER